MSKATKLTSIASKTPTHNPALPRVPITFNGQEYMLEYDFNAIAVAEENTGLNLFGTFDFSHLSVTKFRAMLYSSLIKNHADMTLETAGSFVRYDNLAEITIKMIEAWNGSQPEVTVGNAEAEAAAASGE